MVEYVKVSDVMVGDILIADGGFYCSDCDGGDHDPGDGGRCLDEGQECEVKWSGDGVYVECAIGHHSLDGQYEELVEDDESSAVYIGFTKKG